MCQYLVAEKALQQSTNCSVNEKYNLYYPIVSSKTFEFPNQAWMMFTVKLRS